MALHILLYMNLQSIQISFLIVTNQNSHKNLTKNRLATHQCATSLFYHYMRSTSNLTNISESAFLRFFLAILQDRTNISLYLLSKRSEDGRAFSAHMEIDVVLVL